MFRLLNTSDLLRCLINLHGHVLPTEKHLCMACIVVSCLLFHCMSGTSPRQIPVDILMSLANKYPCIYSVLRYWNDSKLVQSKHVYMYIIIITTAIIIIIIIIIICLLLQRIPGEAELIWWQSWWWCAGQRINTGTSRQICSVERVCYVEGACCVDGGWKSEGVCYLNSAAIRGNGKFHRTVFHFVDLFVPLR